MKRSKTGKPLCAHCRKLATHSLRYHDTVRGERRGAFIYHCDEHASRDDKKGVEQ